MSKAALIMEMPESCYGCNFLYCDEDTSLDSCQAREDVVPVDLTEYDKPDWCPLIPVPDKIDQSQAKSAIEASYIEGWNNCV